MSSFPYTSSRFRRYPGRAAALLAERYSADEGELERSKARELEGGEEVEAEVEAETNES